MSGATALSSSIVGSRFSANWCSVNPPTTRTHCGGGVTATCRFNMSMASAERAHAVPAELHVEVQTTADDVQVVVDQPRQDAAPFQIDDLGRRSGQLHDLAVAPADRDRRHP